MLVCDINCDMGEGTGNEELIMPYISSANIACGYHAGDEQTMRQTIMLAQQFKVKVGAHPSFADRQNFGRTAMNVSRGEVYTIVAEQIKPLRNIASDCQSIISHVKPHGALYNQAAKDKELAKGIAQAVLDADPNLVLYGLSGSYLISEAQSLGLRTASEVFADRTYQDDGSLTPRSQPNSMINNVEECIAQVLCMTGEGVVRTVSGKVINIIADTICIHGDGEHAVEFAKAIYQVLSRE